MRLQEKNGFRGLFAAISLALLTLCTAAAEPSANEILDAVRFSQSRQHKTLSGEIRTDDREIPFILRLRGDTIQYVFRDTGDALILKLGENDSQLYEGADGKASAVRPAEYDTAVRGSDITYEDLALKFLYWNKAELKGEETVRGLKCYRIQLTAPNRRSQYSTVFVWVAKNSGALMRVDGYDWNGQFTKRFEVVSGQKIGGEWILKKMRIQDMVPGSFRAKSRTELYIQGVMND